MNYYFVPSLRLPLLTPLRRLLLSVCLITPFSGLFFHYLIPLFDSNFRWTLLSVHTSGTFHTTFNPLSPIHFPRPGPTTNCVAA